MKLKPLFTWRSAVCESDLPPDVRHVALTLSLHMSERGDSCHPSLDTLRQETGRRKATISESVAVLEAKGWLRVRRGGGRGRPNSYRAVVPKGFRLRNDSPWTDAMTSTDAGEGSTIGTDSSERSDRGTESRPQTVPDGPRNGPPSEREDVLPRGRTSSADAPHPRDEGWEVFLEETGVEQSELSGERRDALNGMLATLRRLTPGLAAGGIRARAREWRRRYPNTPLTPETLVRRWAELGSRKGAIGTPPNPRDGHEFTPGDPRELCSLCGQAEYAHEPVEALSAAGGGMTRSLSEQREDREAAAELAAHARIAVEGADGVREASA